MLTFTEVGKKDGYTQEEIQEAISRTNWETFRTKELPFLQGEAIKGVISQCNIPIKGILRMDLHNVIKGTHGFYSLDVKYANGQAQVYIADDGCAVRVVASNFEPNL